MESRRLGGGRQLVESTATPATTTSFRWARNETKGRDLSNFDNENNYSHCLLNLWRVARWLFRSLGFKFPLFSMLKINFNKKVQNFYFIEFSWNSETLSGAEVAGQVIGNLGKMYWRIEQSFFGFKASKITDGSAKKPRKSSKTAIIWVRIFIFHNVFRLSENTSSTDVLLW